MASQRSRVAKSITTGSASSRASDERERLRRRLVQPLRVVDHADDRAASAAVSDSRPSTARRYEERVRDRAGAEAERRLQRVSLRRGQAVERVEQWCAELMEPGERQLHLGLDTGGAQHEHAIVGAERVVEQRGLADPRLATQHQHTAAAGAGAGEQRAERRQLVLPAASHGISRDHVTMPHRRHDFGSIVPSRPAGSVSDDAAATIMMRPRAATPERIRDMSRKRQDAPSAPPSGWLDAEQQRAWLAYIRVQLRLSYEMNRQLQADSGLSLADYDVLTALSSTAGARMQMTALAAHVGWERSRLSHHVRRMANRDLVNCNSSDSDRRTTEVALSTTGRRAIDEAAPAHVELVKRLFFGGVPRSLLAPLTEALEGAYREILANGTLPPPP